MLKDASKSIEPKDGDAVGLVNNLPRLKLRLPKWVSGLLLLGLLAGAGYVVYHQVQSAQRQGQQRQVQTAVVERMNAHVTISANGIVQPQQSVNVSPKTAGILKELLVQEGDYVRQGQILAYMDDSDLQGQLTQAQGQLALAQAGLQKAKAGNRPQEIAQARARVTELEAALRQTEQTLRENQQLAAQGALPQRDYKNSLAERDRALAQLNQARQALGLQQAGSRPEEIAQAQAEVLKAEGQLQQIQSQVNNTIIRAPFSGVVTRKYADPGSFVTPTTSGSSVSSATSSSILALASVNQVVAKVSETSIPKIQIGQRATIQADAYSDKTLTGKVIQIATQSTVDQNVTNFEVKLSLHDPKRQLRSGMNVSVEFEVGTLDNALVIPTVAIVRQEQGTGVFVAAKGEAQEKDRRSHFQVITTGATVENKTVVLSGLKEGDRVLLSFPPGERPLSRTPSFLPGVGPERSGAPSNGNRRSR
jgi:HlyD family secretion protein